MTSWMIMQISGKTVVAKIGGYTGATETEDPLDDIYRGYLIFLNQAQSSRLKEGSVVTVRIGGKRFRGAVLGGPGRLNKIQLNRPVGYKLGKDKIRTLHLRARKIAEQEGRR